MPYMRYSFTILLTLMTFYGWASPSVATSRFVCHGVGLHKPERSSLWNLSDVSTLDKAGLNRAPRYVATAVHDGDSVRTVISEIIDGRRMRYLVDGSNLIWIGEETPEMHIRVDTLCYTSALLPFGDVSIPLSLHYRSNVIRSDGALVQSATYYPYGEPHRDPAAEAGFGISEPGQQTASATFSNPYLYGDKEYVRRDGLREYIYGARMCVPSETRFNSMDELCELRPWESPYLFCGGNPVRYIDPTGLVFTKRSTAIVEAIESQSLKQLMESIGKVVSGLCSYILSGNKESLKEAFNAAKANAQTIDEIETLKSSQTAYDIEVKSSISDDKEVKGTSYYKWRTRKFKIEVLDDKAYGWIAHELKHAYQFETGKLSTGTSKKGTPFYDKNDEKEAYARGQLFGENMPTFSENEAGYGDLQKGPKQVDPKASDAKLQELATKHKAWFKANGKIYAPPIE